MGLQDWFLGLVGLKPDLPRPLSLAASADGSRAAVAWEGGVAAVYDVEGGERLWSGRGSGVALSPDGAQLATFDGLRHGVGGAAVGDDGVVGPCLWLPDGLLRLGAERVWRPNASWALPGLVASTGARVRPGPALAVLDPAWDDAVLLKERGLVERLGARVTDAAWVGETLWLVVDGALRSWSRGLGPVERPHGLQTLGVVNLGGRRVTVGLEAGDRYTLGGLGDGLLSLPGAAPLRPSLIPIAGGLVVELLDGFGFVRPDGALGGRMSHPLGRRGARPISGEPPLVALGPARVLVGGRPVWAYDAATGRFWRSLGEGPQTP
ncbi:hypothetical protein L6R46_18470 [Myxococcota bacterium]|nr:hypothetical protein [Myxococcota bacterium]